jgi:hypothetical protein
MWRFLQQKFARYGHGHWQRHEDGISKGIPDVSFCIKGVEGWIELKEIEHWPIREKTIVAFRWEPEQRFWARKRGSHGGNVWLLLKVRETKEWLLFWWEDAVDDLGIRWNKKEVLDHAVYYRKGGIIQSDFFFVLSRGVLYAETQSDTPSTPYN